MNKELIMKLTERARAASDNSYCPYTSVATGCALLVEDNMIFTGCNVELRTLSGSLSAGQVAIIKAVSEGFTKFRAICFFSAENMPFPSGAERDLLSEFNPMIDVIVANDQTYSLHTLYQLFPFQPEGPRIE